MVKYTRKNESILMRVATNTFSNRILSAVSIHFYSGFTLTFFTKSFENISFHFLGVKKVVAKKDLMICGQIFRIISLGNTYFTPKKWKEMFLKRFVKNVCKITIKINRNCRNDSV